MNTYLTISKCIRFIYRPDENRHLDATLLISNGVTRDLPADHLLLRSNANLSLEEIRKTFLDNDRKNACIFYEVNYSR